MLSDLMTADEVAALLRVPRSWVYRQTREGQLPSIRCGRYVRFDRNDLELWLAEQKEHRDGASGDRVPAHGNAR